MKKIGIGIVGIITLIMLITACGGSPKATGADELDAAIREASDYFNTRIPEGNKVAFININGGYPDLANYILSDLSKHGVNDGIFSVVDRAQLEAVRAELNFNMSGEVSDQSAQAIGQMLGAQTIVSGSVQQIGTLYRLDIKAIEVQTASVQGQWNRNIPNGATIAALTKNTSGGTATSSGGQTAQAATPASVKPANGTYTFTQRPQAYKDGIPIETYIFQIVVRGNYFLVYLGNKPRGDAANSWVYGFGTGQSTLTNLDNPSRRWTKDSTDIDNSSLGALVYSFENVTGSRFSLENISEKHYTHGGGIFDEFDLSKAEYEP